MLNYEGIFSMNAVVYYSNTGQSLAIAKYVASRLSYPLIEILSAEAYYENLVLVFPVHNQGLPVFIKDFLKRCTIKNLTAIAAYGKMCCGNGLYEIQKKYHKNIVAGAYIPTKHSYIEEASFEEFQQLDSLIEKIKNPMPIKLPRLYKNIFANFMPRIRGRIGVRIKTNSLCDSCGVCTKNCFQHAIKDGVITSNCIRCLKCVYACPKKALSFEIKPLLRLYLKKKRQNQVILYI